MKQIFYTVLVLLVLVMTSCSQKYDQDYVSSLEEHVKDLESANKSLNDKLSKAKFDLQVKSSDEEFAKRLLKKIESIYNSRSRDDIDLTWDYISVFANEFYQTTSYSRVQEIADELNSNMKERIDSKGENLSATITLEEFNKIEIDMTYDQTKKIIGGPGTIMSESDSTVMYSYVGEGSIGANANLLFQNNKLVNKAQYGLE